MLYRSLRLVVGSNIGAYGPRRPLYRSLRLVVGSNIGAYGALYFTQLRSLVANHKGMASGLKLMLDISCGLLGGKSLLNPDPQYEYKLCKHPLGLRHVQLKKPFWLKFESRVAF